MNDSKRLCRIASQPRERHNSKQYPAEWAEETRGRLWDGVRSLMVYGTNMGPSGLLGLVQVGTRTISIG